MTDAPIIRRAKESDILTVCRLEALIFSSHWSRESLRAALSDGYVFVVAEQSGNTAGYAILDERVKDEAELLRIAVSPGLRGKGYARALMEYLIEHERGRGGKIMLEVRASNEAAINLYKSCGFCFSGVRRGYYRLPTEDALLMAYAPEGAQ